MKKLVSSVLAASMVMSLAACGSTASTDSAADSSAASAASSAATTEAAGEGSGAYTGTPIKIGGIGPVTGGAAIYGQAVKNAEELAVKEINAANGSDVFEWKFEDDEHDAEKSVNAYNTLKDWGLAQGAVGDALYRDAEQRADHHRQDDSQHRVHACRAEGKKDNIAADHDDIAVGEVQHLGNAVDHRIAQGDQRVNAAQADTVDQVG